MAFPRIEGYVVTEKLGSGSYSTVYKAYNKVGGRMTVAVKCVDKSRVKHSGSAVDNLITEIRLLKTLSHPHIVKMYDFTWDDKNIYIIMEYCCGGDLSKYIHKYGRVPEKQVRYFLQQLASALRFLYEKGVVHMDLKPHNLLLHRARDGNLLLKVADFGFAQHAASAWSGAVRGSPLYMAPEMLSGDMRTGVGAGAAGHALDLWSVGVIMYECLFGAAPYSSATLAELLDKVQRRAPIQIPANSSISAECRELLHSLLQHDPARRIGYEEFFAHRYLDLEHMPSAENYAKGVALVRGAVALEAAGRAAAALAAYRDALRYLVPCVGAEREPARRAALAHKLDRYMERAEEIKLYLKGGTPAGAASGGGGGGGGRGGGGGSGAEEAPAAPAAAAAPAPAPAPASCEPGAAAAAPVQQAGPAPTPGPAPDAGGGGPAAPRAARFALKRLFGRQSSMPLLEEQEPHSLRDASPAAAGAGARAGAADNDTCRIT